MSVPQVSFRNQSTVWLTYLPTYTTNNQPNNNKQRTDQLAAWLNNQPTMWLTDQPICQPTIQPAHQPSHWITDHPNNNASLLKILFYSNDLAIIVPAVAARSQLSSV